MIASKYDLIIIRGAPGVGKTTLAKLLKNQFNGGVTIEVDTVRGMINNVRWIDKKEHIAALNSTLAMAREYLDADFRPILVVDTLGYSRMKPFLSALKETRVNDRNINYFTISLYCEDKALVNRLLNRSGGFKDIEASRLINCEMRRPAFPPEMLINTTNSSPDKLLEVIINEL